jgi:tetratricopeptide (TPR) repeat protein
MSFAIKHGLFKLNTIDHHAILGSSLNASPKSIRTQYLKIAQKLHPDKCRSDAAKAKTAGQILSKLVNPAYEQLSRKNAFAEHQLVLTQVGRRLVENKDKITVKSEAAQELLKAGDSRDLVYPKLLKKLTSEQYQSLERIEQEIGEISELNLVYLMLKSESEINRDYPKGTLRDRQLTDATPTKEKIAQNRQAVVPSPTISTAPNIEEPTTQSRVMAFVDRAQQYIAKKEFDRAIQELRDSLRIEPNHAVAHAVMGQAYLYKKQLTMAKVHISKACQAEPHNAVVMESKKMLDKMTKMVNKSKTSNSGSAKESRSKSTGGSFFGGLFGGKKK